MTDELMKNFLEYVIQSLDAMSDGVKLLLQNYQETVAEQENPLSDAVSVEQVRTLLISKIDEGKSEQIKELLNLFHVEKLSELNTDHYQELYDMAKKI